MKQSSSVVQWNGRLGHSHAGTGTHSLQDHFKMYFGILNALKCAWREAHTYEDRRAEVFCEWWFNKLDEVTIPGLFCQNQTRSVSAFSSKFEISASVPWPGLNTLLNFRMIHINMQVEMHPSIMSSDYRFILYHLNYLRSSKIHFFTICL